MKQILIDLHADGTPWAVRFRYYVEISDPESGEPGESLRVREVLVGDLTEDEQASILAIVEQTSEMLNNAS
jgi:hypothetical protein